MSESNPWKVLSQKQIYDNPWIAVTEFSVLNPAGGAGIYGKVHFKNIAIGVIVLDAEMNTFLVGQYRFPLDQYSWEIPEGGGPATEDPLDNAKRELLEETGLVAAKWSELFRMHLSNSVSDELAIVYLAQDLQQRSSSPEETEQLAIRKVSFGDAYTMVEQGQITDAISVAAILKLKIMIADGQL